MKKLISVLFMVLLVGGVYASVSAQTTTSTPISSLQALIDQLKQQVTALQAKIEALRLAEQGVREAVKDVKSTLKLIRGLREGITGDDVRLLQIILAADSDVYPEGLITGFYGRLTAKAVRNFQKKFGIEQVGVVGPKTLKKLNEELDNNPLAEGDVLGEGKQPCAIVPPGHLIAPGWLRKQGGVKPIVPECQVLPPGIAKKLGLATTTPPSPTSTDTVAPVISGVAATTTVNSATVSWTTNEPADSHVFYSTTTPVVATSTTLMVISPALVTSHSLNISGLAPAATYYYLVRSKDAAGNMTTSAEFSFATQAADTTAPVISEVSATSTTSSTTHIVWTTNEPATSRVWYSTSTPVVATSTTPSVSSGSLALSHNLILSGLNASTTHYFVAESADAAGNKAAATESSFVTAP